MSLDKEVASHFSAIISGMQHTQVTRARQIWEPKVIEAMTGMVDECLSLTRRALASHQNLQESDRNHKVLESWLAGKFDAIAKEKTDNALGVLAELARREHRVSKDIVTLGGLAGEVDLHGLSLQALAGGPALETAVLKSLAEFKLRVIGVLRAAQQAGEGNVIGISWRLEKHGKWWSNRLKTIAVTLTHAVINRAKCAVAEAFHKSPVGWAGGREAP